MREPNAFRVAVRDCPSLFCLVVKCEGISLAVQISGKQVFLNEALLNLSVIVFSCVYFLLPERHCGKQC